MFDLEPLKKVILASRTLPSKDIIQEILTAVRIFSGEQPQSDDITLMVIRSL
jgi:serine phosphatase RsbU (regulator of sigma subunit)